MWTDQVLRLILKDCVSASVLTGIYAINTLPVLVKYPAALIVNLDKSNSGGSHWVAIFINTKRKGIYFDSFGRPPPKPVVSFLRRNCNMYYVNNIQYQDNQSVYCALFCIVFIFYAVRGFNILSKFNTVHLKKNDEIVKKYIRKIVVLK